jgi:hypothetical protein
LAFSFLASSAHAQFWGVGGTGAEWFDVEWWWTSVFGLEEDWMKAPAIIYNFIIPFIAIFAISLGIIKQLRIFHRNPNIEAVIAFTMAFSTLPSHAFVTLVSWSLAAMGGYAYIAFLALFFIGTTFAFLIKWRGWSGEYAAAGAYVRSLQGMQEQISEIQDQRTTINQSKSNLIERMESGSITQAAYTKRINQLDKQIAELDKEEARMSSRLRTLKRTAP